MQSTKGTRFLEGTSTQRSGLSCILAPNRDPNWLKFQVLPELGNLSFINRRKFVTFMPVLTQIELRTNFLYILLFTAFLTTACASIEKYKGSDLMPVTNIKQIEGEYQNLSDSLPNQYFTFYNIATWRESKPDTSKYESVALTVIDDKHLQLSFNGLGGNSKSVLTRYKLRKNGFVLLKNTHFHVNGLPYIFGDYQVKRAQIGQTREGALLANGTIINEGAILFIMPASFPKHNFSYTFKRR